MFGVHNGLCVWFISFYILCTWVLRCNHVSYWLVSGEVEERARRKGAQEERKSRGTSVYYHKGLAVYHFLYLHINVICISMVISIRQYTIFIVRYISSQSHYMLYHKMYWKIHHIGQCSGYTILIQQIHVLAIQKKAKEKKLKMDRERGRMK